MPRRDDEFDDDDRPRRRRFDDGDDAPPPPRKKSSLGLVLGIVAGILFLLCAGGGLAIYLAASKVSGAAERMTSSNNLKQISLGCLNYQDRYDGMPTDSYGPDGKALLGWRVHILPYMEEDGLYQQFKLNEPWDSPNNIKLLNQMPMVYATPAERHGKAPRGTKTYYRGFTSAGAAFAPVGAGRPVPNPGGPPGKGGIDPFVLLPPPRGIRTTQVSDGTTNTILAIEAGEAIEWTKPGDLDASPGKPFPPVGGIRPKADEFVVVMMDGSTRSLKKTKPEAELRALITCAGNEPVNLD